MSPRAMSARAALERGRIAVPVGGGMEADRDPGRVAVETLLRALDRARQMVVERDDHDAHRGAGSRGVSAHNALSRRTACRA